MIERNIWTEGAAGDRRLDGVGLHDWLSSPAMLF
jgi:hypothetical protein